MLARVHRYLQSSLKHIAELITGIESYYRGGRYRQVSLYDIMTIVNLHIDTLGDIVNLLICFNKMVCDNRTKVFFMKMLVNQVQFVIP